MNEKYCPCCGRRYGYAMVMCSDCGVALFEISEEEVENLDITERKKLETLRMEEGAVENNGTHIVGGIFLIILGLVLFFPLVQANIAVGLLFTAVCIVIGINLLCRSNKSKNEKITNEIRTLERNIEQRSKHQLEMSLRPEYEKVFYKITDNSIYKETNTFNNTNCYITKREDLDKLLIFPKWKSVFDRALLDIDISGDKPLSNYFWCEEIPISNISFFRQEGDFYNETDVSGGGGGGSSIGGAVVGGLLAGGAGAVIGSRKEVDPIHSKTIIHDTRKIVLYYTDLVGTAQTMDFQFDAYKVFMALIPEKEYNTATSSAPKTQEVNAVQKIRELKALFEDGIITEEEFNQKKKELMNRI